jgi:hypothetical protein
MGLAGCTYHIEVGTDDGNATLFVERVHDRSFQLTSTGIGW